MFRKPVALLLHACFLLLFFVDGDFCLAPGDGGYVHTTVRSRGVNGDFKDHQEMRRTDGELHFKYIRMSPRVFDKLLALVVPHLKTPRRYRSRLRAQFSNAEKLVPTLQFLASGKSMQSLAIDFRMGHSTVHNIVVEVCNAIWSALVQNYVKCPSSPEEWKSVADDFYTRWNFPHCLGAVDGKHVVIQAPYNAGSSFFNYKNTHSIVLMAVADAQYCFLYVDIGDTGRHSDGSIFSNSSFGRALNSAELGLPSADSSVPGLGEFPYCFVGDEAFPLRGYLMRPYPGRHLPLHQRIFNYRLSRSRRIIENAFGILVARWRIFRQPIIASPENTKSFVKACVALHNFLQKEQSTKYCPHGFVDSEDANGGQVSGTWRDGREDAGMTPISLLASNNYTGQAKELRDRLAAFLVSPAGSVSWQMQSVTRLQ